MQCEISDDGDNYLLVGLADTEEFSGPLKRSARLRVSHFYVQTQRNHHKYTEDGILFIFNTIHYLCE